MAGHNPEVVELTFCHPRTGRCWANESMAIQMDGPLTSPGPGLVQTGAFAGNITGQVEQLQTGSQFWMNSGYTGPEPPLEVKAVFSTADYARDWIAAYAGQLAASGPVSPAVAQIAATYPAPSAQTVAIWQASPALQPTIGMQNQPGAPTPAGQDYGGIINDINKALNSLAQAAGQTNQGAGQASGTNWLLIGGLALGALLVISLIRPAGSAPRGAYG